MKPGLVLLVSLMLVFALITSPLILQAETPFMTLSGSLLRRGRKVSGTCWSGDLNRGDRTLPAAASNDIT